MKNAKKNLANLSSTERLEALLEETERELEHLQPKIDKLEKQLEKLKELKLAKQKLITLKLSIKSILSNFSFEKKDVTTSLVLNQELSNILRSTDVNTSQKASVKIQEASQVSGNPSIPTKAESTSAMFLPEMAFNQVDAILRKKTSINYDLFRAIILNGGKASTEEIKQYLLDNHIKQPASGEGFETVELTDISSRVNYLVRKGIVRPDGRGTFVSCLGWVEPA
jgi:hypothetical protein